MTLENGVTRDGFLAGRVSVFQPETGYRAGLDAVLLAASLDGGAGDHLAEAGCGAGAALLCAAFRLGSSRLTGYERDAAMVALARRGVAENGLGECASIEIADIAMRPRELENTFDQAFSNPPFFEPGKARPPADGKRAAYTAETPLRDWVLFLLHVVKPRGRITMIHRAAALADLLEELNGRAGDIEVLPVRPAPGAPAHRVLVRARKGLRRGPLRLYDGLALHETPGGSPVERARIALEGGPLEWS